jgi:signal transduction histidine kinase
VNGISDFFTNNIIMVYFLYGLSMFSMGLAIFVEIGRSSELDFAKALRLLAGFGLLHSLHIWFEMFLLIRSGEGNALYLSESEVIFYYYIIHITLLAVSFLLLVAFGARLIVGSKRTWRMLALMLIITAIWVGGLVWVISTRGSGMGKAIVADVYTRYALAIPGTVLASWGLVLQCHRFRQQGLCCFGRDVALAALAFALYGVVGQLFSSPSVIFPSEFLNADVFVLTLGLPIQVFRAAMAALAAVFIIRSLRAFEYESQRQIEQLREAQLAERRRLDATRAELLHRTVKAQESERQRIAMELHDETGQTLTALALGLRGISESLPANAERAAQQANQLEALAVDGIADLQRMVAGLRPPQLDDLGLLAALRWCVREVTELHGLPIQIINDGNGKDLSPDVRVVFFRIAQEALTNVIRHAQATQAVVRLENPPTFTRMTIEDDGRGFDVDAIIDSGLESHRWGLLGMQERAGLVGAELSIHSQPGLGTYIEVVLQKENVEDGKNPPATG